MWRNNGNRPRAREILQASNIARDDASPRVNIVVWRPDVPRTRWRWYVNINATSNEKLLRNAQFFESTVFTFFFTLQPSLPPSGSPLRFDEKRSAGGGSDDPDGFTSAESDDVKADGCKSYGGGGWKIKRGGHRQSGTAVIWCGKRRSERRDERKRDARETGRTRTYTPRRGKGRNGKRGRGMRGIDNSRIYSLTSYTFGCQTFVMKRMLGGLYG